MGKLLKHRKRQTFFYFVHRKALKTLNSTFFLDGEEKVHFCSNLQTFAFVHTRKVDRLAKYDLISNLGFNERHGREVKILNHSLKAFFRIGVKKKKKNFLHCVHGKAPKTQKKTNFYYFVHRKALKTLNNTFFFWMERKNFIFHELSNFFICAH